jgi:hypothetical protein
LISRLWRFIWSTNWNIARWDLIWINRRITYRSRLAYFAKSNRTHFEYFEEHENRSIWKKSKKLRKTRRFCHVYHRFAKSMSACVKFRNFCNRWWRRSYFKRYSIDTLNSFESKNVMMQSKTFVDSNIVDHSFKILTINRNI